MDARSEKELLDVHPDLVKIICLSNQFPTPFIVVQGLRTMKQEQAAVDTNHSTTMHSRHLPNIDGVSCAVDVAWLDHGVVSFAPGREQEIFKQITDQIKESAKNLNIPIICGIDWSSFVDYGHIELPWSLYP